MKREEKNGKKYISLIRFVIFVLVAVILVTFVIEKLRARNAHVAEYIDHAQNADVLVIGSSHAYVNLNGEDMWNEYGIASMCLGQGEQQIRMSTYMLESAIKYNKPKVVVFEVYMAAIEDDYGYMIGQYTDSLLSFPVYRNLDVRVKHMDEIGEDLKTRLGYAVGLPAYHADYASWYNGVEVSTKAGFHDAASEPNLDGYREDRFSSLNITDREPLGPKTEKAINDIIDLCEKEDIKLIFVVTPFQASDYMIRRLNTLGDIAESRGVEYIDMIALSDDIGVDLDTEMFDWGHGLRSASTKNSLWLGKHLIEKYGVEDRRDDPDYAYWKDVVAGGQ